MRFRLHLKQNRAFSVAPIGVRLIASQPTLWLAHLTLRAAVPVSHSATPTRQVMDFFPWGPSHKLFFFDGD